MNNKRPACYAPWITRYEWSTGNITPCCEWKSVDDWVHGDVINTTEHMSLDDSFNHPGMEKIKTQLLEADHNNMDSLPAGCLHCKVLEKNGAHSHRLGLNNVVERAEKYSSYKFNPNEYKQLWLDYRESNLCNFSCKMCGTDLSSTHSRINGVYGKTGIIKSPHKLQMYLDRLDEIQHLNFLGGEPVLSDSMYIILKEARKRNLHHNMTCNITTNGSLLHRNNDNLLELLEGFHHTNIAVSIDAYGEQHNYWRHKGTWDAVYNNTKEIIKWAKDQNAKGSSADVAIRTAISWPTAFAARKTFDMVAEMGVEQRWNVVSTPKGLNLGQLPKHMLAALCVWWQKYPVVAEMFKNTISNPDLKETIKEKIIFVKHDAWHGNSFVETFPEFEDFYNTIPTDNKFIRADVNNFYDQFN